MVSGSRSILKCKAAVSQYSQAVPRDFRSPLLFLYPAWARGFASAATEAVRDEQPLHHSRLVSDVQQGSSPLAKPHNAYTFPTIDNTQKPFDQIHKSSSTSKANRENSHPAIDTNVDKHKESTLSQTSEGHGFTNWRRLRFNNRPSKVRPVFCQGRLADRSEAPMIRRIARKRSSHDHQQNNPRAAMIRKIVRTYPDSMCRWPDLSRNVPLEKKVGRILATAERLEFRWWHDDEIRRMKIEDTIKEKDIPKRHPKEILECLLHHTPKRVEHTVLRISVPNTAVGTLFFGADSNITEIKKQTGCDVELLESEEGKSTRSLLLSGPPICISTAASQIFRIVSTSNSKSTWEAFNFAQYSTQSTTISMHESGVNATPITSNFYLSSGPSNNIPRRADTILKPEILTKNSLELYVRSLTGIKMTSALHKMLYRRDEVHIGIVRQKLLEAFNFDQCMDIISITALNEAISYLVKRNRISAVREIYDRAQRAEFPMVTETFNIILRGCAKSRNVNTFGALLDAMIRRGCHPNSGTWRAFMMLLQEPKDIFQVFVAMQERGLFHEEGLLSDVCEILLPHEVNFCLDKNFLVTNIIDHITSRYGNGWLSLSGANKVLDELGKRGLISECWFFIEYMMKQKIMPNVVSFNTIFTHSVDVTDFATSLESLHLVSDQVNFLPDETTYDILFRHAWRWRCYATARALWQRACLDSCVRFEMRKRVTDSLKAALLFHNTTHPSPPDPPSRHDSLWNLTAGIFVSNKTSETVLEGWPGGADEPSISIWKAHHFATKVVQSDIMLFKDWKPKGSLTELLLSSISADLTMSKAVEDNFENAMDNLLKSSPVIKMTPRVLNITIDEDWIAKARLALLDLKHRWMKVNLDIKILSRAVHLKGPLHERVSTALHSWRTARLWRAEAQALGKPIMRWTYSPKIAVETMGFVKYSPPQSIRKIFKSDIDVRRLLAEPLEPPQRIPEIRRVEITNDTNPPNARRIREVTEMGTEMRRVVAEGLTSHPQEKVPICHIKIFDKNNPNPSKAQGLVRRTTGFDTAIERTRTKDGHSPC